MGCLQCEKYKHDAIQECAVVKNSTCFHRSHQAEVFIWQNFPSRLENEISCTSQHALSYEHIEKYYKGISGKARSRKPGH